MQLPGGQGRRCVQELRWNPGCTRLALRGMMNSLRRITIQERPDFRGQGNLNGYQYYFYAPINFLGFLSTVAGHMVNLRIPRRGVISESKQSSTFLFRQGTDVDPRLDYWMGSI